MKCACTWESWKRGLKAQLEEECPEHGAEARQLAEQGLARVNYAVWRPVPAEEAAKLRAYWKAQKEAATPRLVPPLESGDL